MAALSHKELTLRAKKWLFSQGCGFAIAERVAVTPTGEIPDAIGFRSTCSILIECKTSRADFKADRKKKFRFENPELGMGNFRFYLCEEGVIDPMEVPTGWGLLYIQGKKIKRIVSPEGNFWSKTHKLSKDFWFSANMEAERSIMYSCLRRTR